ncbi:hypothetical protein NDS46_03845 [Paenibacillus thiaminolyticus]|uniref:hypothetical protein n=1 Tax=Paenibacillus thiaminolyticus TaxID=49283 RepID=UPI0023306512|nr:hypothetical protein [Paenibacillus thiaminolyticus]WCF09054.1 hypothetical protein NDS46_03845 [Paenibacillus thiaminolyticus]
MNSKNETENYLERNTWERSFHDFIYTNSLPKKVEKFILKFHQASTVLQVPKRKNDIYDSNIYPWLGVVEKTDVSPEYYESEVMLHPKAIVGTKGSFINYDLKKKFTLEEISLLMNSSFGRDISTRSKKYGSAGGLYPVIPLLLVFEQFFNFTCGVYVYNSEKQSMMKIRGWSEEKSHYVKNEVCHYATNLPNTCIAYAVDIKRAILKYHIRGYRHAIIEVGAMSQVFKQSLHALKENVGEISWSGYNDNQLSVECGLNVRLCPIMLLQWFGHVK